MALLAPAQPVLRPPALPAPGLYRRILLGSLLAVTAAAAVLLGRGSGSLDGVAGLLVAVSLVLLVPTSRELSRRILLAGCLVAGWMPVLWWWDLPVGRWGRATLGLAVLAGALGWWVGCGESPIRRLRLLLPRVRAVDLLAPLSAGLGAVVLWPWLQIKSGAESLGLMMSGWDNSAHFSMVHMIRRYGVTVDALAAPPPTGGTWQFAGYPQGFHTIVATIVELMVGPRQADLETELFLHTRAVALLVVAATAMLVAGFCALPALRIRPGIAAPVAAFVAAVMLLGPGADALQGGFANFALACVLVVAIALVGLPMARVLSPLHLAAIGGAVVGVATGWVLLLVLAAPALLVVCFPLRSGRWAATPARIATSIVIVLAVLACLARTAVVILRVQPENPLLLSGGIVPPDLGLVVVAVLATLGACLLAGRTSGGPGPRIAMLGAVPVLGAVAATGLVVAQIQTSGTVTYYGLKFMTGLEIVLLALLVIPSVYLLARRRRPARTGRVAGFVGSMSLAVAATQVFGLAAPDGSGLGLAPEAPGAVNRAEQVTVLEDLPTTAFLADRVPLTGTGTTPVYYLDVPSDRRVDPILAAQWYFALTDSWTIESNIVAGRIRYTGYFDADVSTVARRILLAHPDAEVAVRADRADALADALDDPFLARRIVRL